MTQYRPIWNHTAIKILRDNWNTLPPHEIRKLIIENQKAWASETGRDRYAIPSIGGVLHTAYNQKLITSDEYRELYGIYERRPITPKKRQEIIDRDGGKCLVCFSKSRLEVDHIVPVFFGGTNDDDNLQTLCRRCHRVKGMDEIDCRQIEYVAEYEVGDDGSLMIYPGVSGIYAEKAAAVALSYLRADAILSGGNA